MVISGLVYYCYTNIMYMGIICISIYLYMGIICTIYDSEYTFVAGDFRFDGFGRVVWPSIANDP